MPRGDATKNQHRFSLQVSPPKQTQGQVDSARTGCRVQLASRVISPSQPCGNTQVYRNVSGDTVIEHAFGSDRNLVLVYCMRQKRTGAWLQ
eukprot:gene2289-3143_t